MKNEFPFDDFIRGQFNNYTPDVPERIWKNIVAGRNTKPKGFWMNWLNAGNVFMISLILITAIMGYYFISSPQNKINIAAQNENIVKQMEAFMKAAHQKNNDWILFPSEK